MPEIVNTFALLKGTKMASESIEVNDFHFQKI